VQICCVFLSLSLVNCLVVTCPKICCLVNLECGLGRCHFLGFIHRQIKRLLGLVICGMVLGPLDVPFCFNSIVLLKVILNIFVMRFVNDRRDEDWFGILPKVESASSFNASCLLVQLRFLLGTISVHLWRHEIDIWILCPWFHKKGRILGLISQIRSWVRSSQTNFKI